MYIFKWFSAQIYICIYNQIFVLFFSANRSSKRKHGFGGRTDDSCGQSKKKKRASNKKCFPHGLNTEQSVYNRNYYLKNKDKITLKRKDVRMQKRKQSTLPERSVYDSRYYLKNKNRISSRNRALYRKNREQFSSLEFPGRMELYAFDEDIVVENDVGIMEYMCGKCDALMFRDEQHRYISKESNALCFSLCCSYGHVKAPPVSEPPLLLRTLLSGNSSDSRHFIQNIRAYNSAFAFASMTLTGSQYEFQGRGPYCFRINGQIYHTISQLLPEAGHDAKFSQIYLYDAAAEVNARINLFNSLHGKIMQNLQDMVNRVNPYAALYHGVRDLLHDDPTTDVTLVLKTSGDGIDNRRYNVPTGTDIAMVIPVENENQPLNKNIVIYKNRQNHPAKSSLMTIDDKNPMYDPLLYVLMFPFGDKGWELKSTGTCLQYYGYRLMIRSGATFNIIHRMGRLFQQYIVDMYSKVEAARLAYIRFNQTKLRAEVYKGLSDAIRESDGNVDGSRLGKRVILPSSFTGSAHYQHQLYQDAMAIVRHYGKPDLFITFTCNPQWPEITKCLFQNQTSADRPDIVARVFKLKLKSLLHDIYYAKQPIFGKMCAIIYVIEWQKQGPPHAHILAICDNISKPHTTKDYDSIVSAEIPHAHSHPKLHAVVTKFMMHGPCGTANPKSPCMIDGQCSKRFPKEYVKETYAGSDGYPHYRRRNTGLSVNKSGVPLDNKYVVPYNPYLSKKYNAHINVEICSSIQSCKYLYKYVYKGPDMASVGIDTEDKGDEIKRFVNSRFITASECMWRFFTFDVHGRDPSIQRLAVHEHNKQSVIFKENNVVQALEKVNRTTLLAWFQLNHRLASARKFKYHEIPEHFVWNTRLCQWTERKRGRCIGRMYTTLRPPMNLSTYQ